ncbi:TfoX/Sxy family protein [Hyphomonas sp.]|jgi:DNA transformation protein|uniref:TfoX/Sxy family protein n=1 Tax=Hyphomonas sp. TaxID=87 RepID=UPI0039E4F079
MAKPPDPFHDFVTDLFAPMGDVRIKRMFGGAGVYAQGMMFALLAEDVIYLKTDAALRSALEFEGGEAFVWERPSDGKRMEMGYVGLPSAAMDDADDASAWGRRALSVALAAKKPKPAKKTQG